MKRNYVQPYHHKDPEVSWRALNVFLFFEMEDEGMKTLAKLEQRSGRGKRKRAWEAATCLWMARKIGKLMVIK
ncbi:MAG: hypothetical protein ACI3X3_07250 [Acidaminococcus sp.]|uniref:hypothetical protein n=1 Tax=Acidaminococcus sp. TaxID=1872103 RepID=UPI0015B3A5C2